MAIDIMVIGLGKLGLPLAAVCAGAGFSVLGYDQEICAVSAASTSKPRFPEPNLAETLQANHSRLFFTNGFPKNIRDCKAIFICVPTPSEQDGTFSSEQVEDVLKEIAGRVKVTDVHKPPICIASTLFPGTMEKLAERFSALRLFYTPTMIALGNVLEGLRHPDFQLVGTSFEDGADVSQVFVQIHTVNSRPPPVPLTHFMSYESAEIAKLAANAFVTMKISFANRIGEICEVFPGANRRDILETIGQDKRIGEECLVAGAPYGGPCFPRDVEAIAQLDPLLGYSIYKMNEAQVKAIALRAHNACPEGKPILIMGVSYKPGLPILDGSPSMAVHAELTRFYKRKCYLWDSCGTMDENPDWTLNALQEGHEYVNDTVIFPSLDIGCLILMHATYGEGAQARWIRDFEGAIIDPWMRP